MSDRLMTKTIVDSAPGSAQAIEAGNKRDSWHKPNDFQTTTPEYAMPEGRPGRKYV